MAQLYGHVCVFWMKKKIRKRNFISLQEFKVPLRSTFSFKWPSFLLVAEINIKFENKQRYVKKKKNVRKSKKAIEPKRNHSLWFIRKYVISFCLQRNMIQNLPFAPFEECSLSITTAVPDKEGVYNVAVFLADCTRGKKVKYS